MRILWFCNTPCCALEIISNQKGISGGWLDTLSTELSHINNIELHIGFYWYTPLSSFQHKGIYYHPIFLKGSNNKLSRWYKRLKSNILINQFNPDSLLNIVNKTRPDIIHIHGTEEDFGLIANYIKSIPITISIQGFLSSIHCKLFAGIPYNKAFRYESILSKINQTGAFTTERNMRSRCAREQNILKLIQYIIGRTDFDRYCSLIYNPKRRYFKVNEIMRTVFFQNKWEKENFSSTFTITTTISNGLYKGLEMIYNTSYLLKQCKMDFSWEIIGLNSNDNQVKTIEKYTKLNAKDLNIKFLGRQNATQICKVLQNADLYCQTSHIENSSNSTCEAMVLGMPIIASYAGGTSSLITHHKTGGLVQDGDPYALGGAILELSQSFKKAKEMGDEARKFASENFSSQHVTNELLKAYHDILNITNI